MKHLPSVRTLEILSVSSGFTENLSLKTKWGAIKEDTSHCCLACAQTHACITHSCTHILIRTYIHCTCVHTELNTRAFIIYLLMSQ